MKRAGRRLWLLPVLDHLPAPRQSSAMTDQTDQTDLSTLSFEAALKQLEQIVARLESGEAALDESITLYTKGEALRAQCEARLKDAQARIEKITLGANGQPAGTSAFDAG
jgi:exodeoxyribonuclease VII small subunit